jgi:perosamine synthetase
LLRNLDGVEVPLADDEQHVRSWFVYVVKLAEGLDRERVIAGLEERGVASARYLPSIHLQQYMRERYGFAEGMCPVSEDLSRRTFALPFHSRLPADDQEYVVDALRVALAAA